MNLTTIYIARHGETEWNVKGLVQGHADSPLTTTGEQQARELHGQFKDIKFDIIFSSDLLRAQRTAEIVALERKLAVQTTKALREISFGKYEGTDKDEFLKAFKDWKNLSDKERLAYRISPESESGEEAASRFIIFLREIAVAYQGKTILLISHNAVMRNFLVHMGYLSFDDLRGFKNGGYIKLESDGVDFFLKDVIGVKKEV